ncbi:sodium:calcium exchanger [Shewanella sp. OPT22]|nr:sodium:calcium exchanger [Shewanella sp. OPT22]
MKLRNAVIFFIAATAAMAPLDRVLAHAEHDKARFVSTSGKNIGRCDNPLRPCETIAYAVKHANKGDRVLVSGGQYDFKNSEDVFLLTSDLVPVLGGYNKFDHFLAQAPQHNPTLLTGIPQAFVSGLESRGFKILNDGIAQYGVELSQKLEQNKALERSQPATECTNGTAGNFSCNNIDLVAHMALGDFSKLPSSGNDIWGHVDLNTGTEYAIMGFNNGTSVINLSDPENPAEVGFIGGTRTTWRDIKVYQWFDSEALRWKAHAYVTSEGADNVHIIDLSDLPDAISKVATDNASTSAHNVYISNVDYTTNSALTGLAPSLHLVGQNIGGGAFRSYHLTNPAALGAEFNHTGSTRSDYAHDASSMVVTDSRAQSSCQTSICTVLLDFNEDEMRLWNISEQAAPDELSNTTYTNAEYVHSGWWSEDKRYVFVHDELDEQRHGLNTTLRVFNVDNLQAPQLVKTWSGPTKAIDHNGFVRGNRYYMSNYQRGVTILDISDPSSPSELGYFDTFPASDGNAFNGVWGVYPYLPSGLILASDINSGLYVLRDKTHSQIQGSISFSESESRGNPGDTISISVQRPQGSGEVSVAYEVVDGNTELGIDYQPISGRLTWTSNDNAPKTIELVTLNADKDIERQAFVKLHDPRGGASIVSPTYHIVKFGENAPRPGTLAFEQTSVTFSENVQDASVNVLRSGGTSGTVKVNYHVASGTAEVGNDLEEISGELVWQDGDSDAKPIPIKLIDDSEVEDNETFTVQLTSADGSALAANELVVTISDNDSVNKAPVVSAGDNRDVNASETVTLTATATDADGDSISYQWKQVSGTSVTLNNASTQEAQFVAPNQNGVLVFSVVATDANGESSEAEVSINVVVQQVPEGDDFEESGSSGGGSLSFISLVLILLIRRKRI